MEYVLYVVAVTCMYVERNLVDVYRAGRFNFSTDCRLLSVIQLPHACSPYSHVLCTSSPLLHHSDHTLSYSYSLLSSPPSNNTQGLALIPVSAFYTPEHSHLSGKVVRFCFGKVRLEHMPQATTAVLLLLRHCVVYCIEWLCSACFQLELQTRMLQDITIQGERQQERRDQLLLLYFCHLVDLTSVMSFSIPV